MSENRRNPSDVLRRFGLLQRRHTTAIVGMVMALVWIGEGCTTPAHDPRSQIATALLGKTKNELVNCAGKPLQELVQRDVTVLIYYKDAPELESSFMGSKSGMLRKRHGCRARIVLTNDRVEGIEYESVPETFGGEDHCDEIFQGCGPVIQH
jgi:hypothetical protein